MLLFCGKICSKFHTATLKVNSGIQCVFNVKVFIIYICILRSSYFISWNLFRVASKLNGFERNFWVFLIFNLLETEVLTLSSSISSHNFLSFWGKHNCYFFLESSLQRNFEYCEFCCTPWKAPYTLCLFSTNPKLTCSAMTRLLSRNSPLFSALVSPFSCLTGKLVSFICKIVWFTCPDYGYLLIWGEYSRHV